MAPLKITLAQVLEEDDSPFWRSIQANPGYPQFEEKLGHIIAESRRHGMLYVDITKQPDNTTTGLECIDG